MNERDELAKLLGNHQSMGCGCCAYGELTSEQSSTAYALEVSDYAVVLADSVLSAGYRKPQQIVTVDDLEELSVGTVVLDRAGMALQRTMWLGWVASNGSTNIDREELERDCFPATVLHVGSGE